MRDLQIGRITGDIAGAVFFIAVAAGAYLISLDFIPPVLPGDPGAAFFPQLIATALLLFACILLYQRLRRGRAAAADETDGAASDVGIDLVSFATTVGSVLALIVAMATIGFEISAFGFLFLLLGWRTGRWLWAGAVSLVAVAVMYVTFVALLKVHLPMMFLPKYIYF